ncbi:MAG: hypothetical protein ACK47B_13845 [Armatimonadota bacterium]
MRIWHLTLIALAILLTSGAGLYSVRAQADSTPEAPAGGLDQAQEQPPVPEEGQPGDKRPMDPSTVWPVSLKRLAGTYRFDQVASPGGFWETREDREGRSVRSQIAITNLPPQLRRKLEQAEIVIKDLEPSRIEAFERESPSKRGLLRYYTETARGTLQLKNLPGIGAQWGDDGVYSGPAQFVLDHQSHSNPSPSGVFQTRQYQERTWGAATLDYADLVAYPITPEKPEAGQPGAGKPGKQPGQKPAPKPSPKPAPNAKPQPDREEDPEDEHPEENAVIGNARVMRSGLEIYAFVELEHQDNMGKRQFVGAIRMLRQGVPGGEPPAAAPMRPPVPTRVL